MKTILFILLIILVGGAPSFAQSCKEGVFLGRLRANPYAADSVSNPYGQYGSKYSPTSINNPTSQYGSTFSPMSPKNPYTTTAPVLCGEK